MDRSAKWFLQACSLAMLMVTAAGCGMEHSEFTTDERLDRGLVVILPGIEGVSNLNRNIRRGLVSGGCFQALPIYSWGRPIPGVGLVLNQVDFLGNRIAGSQIAQMIVQYQDNHPGKPVHIVGHSGGGGVAVFAAEGMPEGRQIDGLVLLSASIWHGYDLTKALSRCKNGIVNFYNPEDAAMLAVGTTLLSNVDGMKGPSAGLNGFRKSFPGLYQVSIASYGGNPHTAVTEPGYVATFVAPWVLSSTWPAAATSSAPPVPNSGENLALHDAGRQVK